MKFRPFLLKYGKYYMIYKKNHAYEHRIRIFLVILSQIQ